MSSFVRAACTVALVVAACLAARPAVAQTTLISNLDGNDGTQSSTLNDLRNKGMGFTMPAGQDYTLDYVTLRLETFGSGVTPIVELWTNAGGLPGAVIETLVNPAFAASGIANYNFTSAGSTLVAGGSYWIVAYGTAAAPRYDWKASSPAQTPTGLATHLGSLYDANGPPPTTASSALNSYSVTGTGVGSSGCPHLVGSYDTPGDAFGVAVAGAYAYVADGDSGLRVVNVSNPAAPFEVGFYDTPGHARGVAVAGFYAYVADGGVGGLRVVDVSNPAAPFEVGFYDTPATAEGVAVAGAYAYVADGDSGLRVVNVSTPAVPFEVGSYDTPGIAHGVAVAGFYAYVADWGGGLRVVDVSNPAAPFEVGSYDTPGAAFGVAVAGSYAYVADFETGLRVVNVSTPVVPFEVGFYDTPGIAHGVAVAGSYAYVADGGVGGLRVVDVSNPAAPVGVGSYDTPGAAYGVAVAGSYAYVADGGAGLQVLTACEGLPFEDGFESGDTSAWSATVP